MNESSITIRWEKNHDGCTDIAVNGDIDGHTHFREAFLSLDNIPSVICIGDKETSGESAVKSATIALLTQIIEIIRKSDKTNGQIISEQEHNFKFLFTDLVTRVRDKNISLSPSNIQTHKIGRPKHGRQVSIS